MNDTRWTEAGSVLVSLAAGTVQTRTLPACPPRNGNVPFTLDVPLGEAEDYQGLTGAARPL
jgi:hypothetical protein